MKRRDAIINRSVVESRISCIAICTQYHIPFSRKTAPANAPCAALHAYYSHTGHLMKGYSPHLRHRSAISSNSLYRLGAGSSGALPRPGGSVAPPPPP
jgi:hypothetical protein